MEITNAWQGHEIWTLAGKTIKSLDSMDVLLIEDGYFCIRMGDNSYNISMTSFGYNPKLLL